MIGQGYYRAVKGDNGSKKMADLKNQKA